MTRAALAAFAGAFAALALGAPALAAYRPHLLVLPHGRTSPQGTQLLFAQPPHDDATARMEITVPAAYSVTVGQPPGTVLGAARATVAVRGFDVGPIAVTGRAVVADPAPHALAAGACGVVAPAAVWRLELATTTGQALAVMLFVERSETAVRLVGCLPSPDLPEAAGGAPFGAQLVSADVTVAGVFTAPRERGRHVWSSLFTPYRDRTAVPGPAVEARAVVPVPAQLGVTGKVVRRPRRSASLQGRLLEAGVGVAGVRVELWEAVYAPAEGARRVAMAATECGGRFAFRRPASPARWYLAFVQPRATTARDCGGSTAPGGCVNAHVAPAASRWIRVPVAKIRPPA